MYVYYVCICACMYKSAFMCMYVFMQRKYIVCMCVFMCIFACLHVMYVCNYVFMYNVCASIKCVCSLFVYQSVHLSACPPAHLSFYLYVHLSIFLYYLSVCRSDWCMYVCMSCYVISYNIWIVVIAQKPFSLRLED